jgi:hypothetical protein
LFSAVATAEIYLGFNDEYTIVIFVIIGILEGGPIADEYV